MIKLKMKSYNMISIEKQQKYLPYHQENFINMNILQVKIYYRYYSPLGKAFDKQIKAIEDQGKKQVDALNNLKPSDKDKIPESAFAYEESRKELNKIKEIEKNADRGKLIYKTNKDPYDFRKFKTIRAFGESIYIGKITLEEADESQSDLLREIKNFNDKKRLQTFKKKQMKEEEQGACFLMVLKARYF